MLGEKVAGAAVSLFLYILSYIQVFPYSCTYCRTYKCFPTLGRTVAHTSVSPLSDVLSHIQVFPHSQAYCRTYKCFPTLGRTVTHTSVSPLLYILTHIQVQCYLPLWWLHFDFLDFNNRVCHVMKITIAENNPDVGLFTQEFALAVTFMLEPIMMISVAL